MLSKQEIIKVKSCVWEIPSSYRFDMRVPARIYASDKLLEEVFRDRSLEQLINVATLPGIVNYALAMPDAHEGYGFPVGGVAAFDPEAGGIISPGGIGYDINCGVRLLRSGRNIQDVAPYLEKLSKAIYREVPSGVGRGGRLALDGKDLDLVLERGAARMVEMGYGDPVDLEKIESQGCLSDADASLVSQTAKSRGRDQLGTMGAGNHFVEIEVVDEIFDAKEAERFDIKKGQVMVLIHTGSRGLGHQIATDYIALMTRAMSKYSIVLPDRELACAPFSSDEGGKYWRAMSAGANFAWANRQLITWEVRKAWNDVLGREPGELGIVYDVAHNIAKLEEYDVDGVKKTLIVHRKGATRAFPGQPVLIPGSMGTASYLLVGEESAMKESFGSSCHGAGRRMSRAEAKRKIRGSDLKEELEERGIEVKAGSLSGLAEEAPQAYKDVDEVVDVVHNVGIAKKVARLRPVAVIKG